jgi:hypothetical protein
MMKHILGIIGLLIIVFMLAVGLQEQHEEQIANKVESMGAELVSIERNGVFEDDPFGWTERTKQEDIYQFFYEEDGEVKEGWVSFLYFNDIWKFDVDKN